MLTLFDCVCIIVGTIIGAGIFEMPAIVASNVPDVYWLAAVWIFGGVIALIGALCFAELTTTYPDRGGDYGYLKRGYHQRVGFAFSWAAFWVIRPGNIGAMAMIFGKFATQAFPGTLTPLTFAVLSVAVITGTNLLGIKFGKTVLNILTVAKVLGILFIVGAAFVLSSNDSGANSSGKEEIDAATTEASAADVTDEARATEPNVAESQSATESSADPADETSVWSSFWLAMVFVMFAFGGWNDIAFVATEVQQPKKNLLRSLLIGTVGVLAIYLLINFALAYGLGFDAMASIGSRHGNPTLELVGLEMGQAGLTFFALLVCTSCLGAINAMIFTSPRIYWATAMDYPALSWLTGSKDDSSASSDNGESASRRNGSSGWWRAMLLQAVVTIVFVVGFGWSGSGGVRQIVIATAPYFWLFLTATVISLIVCRIRYRGQFTGYRVPFFPLLPLIFIAACIFMSYRAYEYMWSQDGLWKSSLLIGLWVLGGFGLSFVLQTTTQLRSNSDQ